MKTELRQALALMNARCTALHSLTPNARQTTELLSAFKDLVAPKDADEKEAALLMRDAWSDPQKRRELCALRVETINNYVRVSSNLSSMLFEEVTLADDERPAFVNTSNIETTGGMISQDGRPRRTHLTPPQGQTMIDLFSYATEEVEYSIKDIYNGDISAPAKASVDLAGDLANILDLKAYNLLTAALGSGGALGAFVTTGSKHLRTFNLHSRVKTANLPTTNILTLDSTSAWPYPKTVTTSSTRMRMDVARATLKYCDAFGQVLGLRPTGIIVVPSIDAGDLMDEADPLASSTPQTPLAEGLTRNYTRFSLGDVNWTIVPDVTLASGKCYPILNKPVGRLYRKPSQDQDVPMTDLRNNRETRFMKGVAGLYIPTQWRPHALQVIYKS